MKWKSGDNPAQHQNNKATLVGLVPELLKGERCVHRSRCNFDMLKSYVGRAKVCPIVGCDAPLARSHGVQRDDALRAALAAVPAAVDVVWLRGTEVRTTAPSAAAPASAVAVG